MARTSSAAVTASPKSRASAPAKTTRTVSVTKTSAAPALAPAKRPGRPPRAAAAAGEEKVKSADLHKYTVEWSSIGSRGGHYNSKHPEGAAKKAGGKKFNQGIKDGTVREDGTAELELVLREITDKRDSNGQPPKARRYRVVRSEIKDPKPRMVPDPKHPGKMMEIINRFENKPEYLGQVEHSELKEIQRNARAESAMARKSTAPSGGDAPVKRGRKPAAVSASPKKSASPVPAAKATKTRAKK